MAGGSESSGVVEDEGTGRKREWNSVEYYRRNIRQLSQLSLGKSPRDRIGSRATLIIPRTELAGIRALFIVIRGPRIRGGRGARTAAANANC